MSAHDEWLTFVRLLLDQPGVRVDLVKIGDPVRVTIPDFGIDGDYLVLDVAPDGAVFLQRIAARGADTPATQEADE